MKFRWLILLVLFLTFSCGRGKLPEGILPKNKMVPMLVDQHLAQQIFSLRFQYGLKGDSIIDDLYLSILKKYNVSRKEFEESVYYYSKHPEKYKPVYDEVLNRLNAMEVKIKKEQPELKRCNQPIMRRLSAQFIITGTGDVLKKGIVTVNDKGIITELIDTGGDLTETSSLEFYNGILVPGFVNAHCHLELSHLKDVFPQKTQTSRIS